MENIKMSLYIVLPSLNAFIAQMRNRSPLNWFLITAIIGPVATLLLFLYDIPKIDHSKSLKRVR